MIFGNMLKGNIVTLTDGKGSGSDLVWISHPNGIHYYKYGMRVQDIVLANGNKVQFSNELPFTIQYQAPAYYLGGVQNQELVATLIPKTFNVIYKFAQF